MCFLKHGPDNNYVLLQQENILKRPCMSIFIQFWSIHFLVQIKFFFSIKRLCCSPCIFLSDLIHICMDMYIILCFCNYSISSTEQFFCLNDVWISRILTGKPICMDSVHLSPILIGLLQESHVRNLWSCPDERIYLRRIHESRVWLICGIALCHSFIDSTLADFFSHSIEPL